MSKRNYNSLTDREIEVLACRYFLDMSLAAIGLYLKSSRDPGRQISRQRVKQIETCALRKIRKKPPEFW